MRIENVVMVQPLVSFLFVIEKKLTPAPFFRGRAQLENDFGEIGWLQFENVTMVGFTSPLRLGTA